jgi:hypothetical protein
MLVQAFYVERINRFRGPTYRRIPALELATARRHPRCRIAAYSSSAYEAARAYTEARRGRPAATTVQRDCPLFERAGAVHALGDRTLNVGFASFPTIANHNVPNLLGARLNSGACFLVLYII